MKRSDAAKLLPIIEAWSKGETIQVRTVGNWIDMQDDACGFIHDAFCYRIKPKPVSIWVASWIDEYGDLQYLAEDKEELEGFRKFDGFQLHEIVRDA